MGKSYKELSKTAKKGLNKFVSLPSSNCMKKYGEKFRDKTGRSSYNVSHKEEFYKFVAKNKVRC